MCSSLLSAAPGRTCQCDILCDVKWEYEDVTCRSCADSWGGPWRPAALHGRLYNSVWSPGWTSCLLFLLADLRYHQLNKLSTLQLLLTTKSPYVREPSRHLLEFIQLFTVQIEIYTTIRPIVGLAKVSSEMRRMVQCLLVTMVPMPWCDCLHWKETEF